MALFILSRYLISSILQTRNPVLTLGQGEARSELQSLQGPGPFHTHPTIDSVQNKDSSDSEWSFWRCGEEGKQLVRRGGISDRWRSWAARWRWGRGHGPSPGLRLWMSQRVCVCTWMWACTREVGSQHQVHRSRTNLPPPASGSSESRLLS